MNTPIVNDAFRFVKWALYDFLPEHVATFRFHQAMDIKNEVVSRALSKGLSDRDIESLALSALLQATAYIENNKYSNQVSQAISRSFLTENGVDRAQIEQICRHITAMNQSACPEKGPERLLWTAQKDRQVYRMFQYYKSVNKEAYKRIKA
jgi:hypothetical protein